MQLCENILTLPLEVEVASLLLLLLLLPLLLLLSSSSSSSTSFYSSSSSSSISYSSQHNTRLSMNACSVSLHSST